MLARPVGGPAVMAAQRRRLLEDATRPAVTIQVLPVSAGAHAGMDGPFTIFGFPAAAERDVVALDSAADALYLESPEDLARYRRVFELLLPAALTPRRRPRSSPGPEVELAAPDPVDKGLPLHGGELEHRAVTPLLGVAHRDPVADDRHLHAPVGGAEGALAPHDACLVLHRSPSPSIRPGPPAGRRSQMLTPSRGRRRNADVTGENRDATDANRLRTRPGRHRSAADGRRRSEEREQHPAIGGNARRHRHHHRMDRGGGVRWRAGVPLLLVDPARRFKPLNEGMLTSLRKLWWCRPCETTWVA